MRQESLTALRKSVNYRPYLGRFYGFAGLGAKSAAESAFAGSVGDIPLKLNFWARAPGATSAA